MREIAPLGASAPTTISVLRNQHLSLSTDIMVVGAEAPRGV